jgi:hypothetical protein
LACCESCVDSCDSVVQQRVADAARAALAAREEHAKQSPPEPPVLGPRRSGRATKPVEQIYDLNRSGKGQPAWSAYDLERLDSRHGRTREESYPELQAAHAKLRAEVENARREQGELAARLDSVYGRLRELAQPGDEIELNDCETAAAVILREARAELMGHQERHGEEAAAASAPLDGGECAADSAPLDGGERDSVAWTVGVPVRMGGVDGTPGKLSIASGYVAWNPISGASDDPWQQLPLCDIICADYDDQDEVRCAAFRAAHMRTHRPLHACSTGCGDASRSGDTRDGDVPRQALCDAVEGQGVEARLVGC